MAMPVPQKIVLKSSTSISLNDRFSKIAKFTPPTVQTVRLQMANQHDSSIKNRRFAQQMANRNLPVSPNRDISSRLGTPSVLLRLGYRRGLGSGLRRGRSFRDGFGNRPLLQLNQNVSNFQGGVQNGRGIRKRGRGGLSRGVMSFGVGLEQNAENQEAQIVRSPRGRRKFQKGPGRGASYNAGVSTGNQSVRQWASRGRGGRRGRGRGRQPNVEVTRDQLDNELDEYMAHTD